MNEERIRTLNDLVQLDIDAVEAYRQAIDACTVAEVRDNLTAFMGDHERHISELGGVVRSLGGVPPEGKDLKGFVIEGFTAIMSVGDRSALLAMRGNEEITTRRYDAARRATLDGAVLDLVEKNYEDEVRHLAWIKQAIVRKVWEKRHGKAA
jgi:uncharacterized protein (TIGR02284 family)